MLEKNLELKKGILLKSMHNMIQICLMKDTLLEKMWETTNYLINKKEDNLSDSVVNIHKYADW